MLHLRYGDGAEYGEERVDDIVLPHEDRTEEVRNDDEAKVTRVVAAHAEEKDEHDDVDDKNDAEEPPVEREDLVAEISCIMTLSLVWQFVLRKEIAFLKCGRLLKRRCLLQC